MTESLHNHTTTSDGVLSHEELYSLGEQLGLSVIAFTDHDSLPGKDALRVLDSKRDHALKWIIGIEVTASLPLECEKQEGTVHVIGLFVDPENLELRSHCARAQEARKERMKYIVEKLNEIGFEISEDDCLMESGGEAVGRPHIVAALKKYPQNDDVFERLREEMHGAAGQDALLKVRYEEMMSRGPRQYPYSLVLSLDAFRSAYKEISYCPDIDEAVRLIRHAGGMAFLAHYSYERKKLPMEVLRVLLKDNRIDGVEVFYGGGVRGMSNEAIFEEDKIALRTMATMYGRLISGGADTHYPEDLERYVSDKSTRRESDGLAQNILNSGCVSVRNSSF